MWLSSSYNRTSVDDSKLQVGGWGDQHRMFIQFDLSGLPQTATSAVMWLYAYPRGDSSTPVAMPLYLLTTPWSETSQDYYTQLQGYSLGTVPAPTPNSWYGLNITSIYNGWKNGTYVNDGFVFLPAGTNNQFNVFRSSDYSIPFYRPMLVVTYNGANLGFPLECSTPNCSGTGNIAYTYGAYTPQGLVSVVDYHMNAVYSGKDGVIVAFTGEEFDATSAYPSTAPQACYSKKGNATWSTLLTSLYSGTVGSGSSNCVAGVALNYEAHPGYDYRAYYSTPVKAAATGTVVNFAGQRCIPKGLSSCDAFGAVGIDHGNGYITQYLHLNTRSVYSGDTVMKGAVIGLSGDTGVQGSPHLHFEVLKRVSGSSGTSINDYKVVDPYGWKGEYGADPLEAATGMKNVCLWDNCQL